MSARVSTYLICDRCQHTFSCNLGVVLQPIAWQRAESKRDGWHRKGKFDYCASCWPQIGKERKTIL